MEGVVTIDKSESEKHKWLMTFKKDNLNGSYFIFGESILDSFNKPTALYKVSCLFKIKYNKDEVFLKEFGKLNKLRNDIAHGTKRVSVKKKDLINILNILGLIRKK